MPLRERIDSLLELSDEELKDERARDLEDAVQCGLMAVNSGELWIRHVQRQCAAAREADPDRAAALERELAKSRATVAEVRSRVAALHTRAQELGVGAPV